MFVDGRTFDPLLTLLPERRLIVVDGPGLGASEALHRRTRSSKPPTRPTDLLTGAQASALGIEGPVDWVGNAFGGHVGYELLGGRGCFAASPRSAPPPSRCRRGRCRQIRMLGPLLRTVGPVGPVRSAILQALLTDASTADSRHPHGGPRQRRHADPAQPVPGPAVLHRRPSRRDCRAGGDRRSRACTWPVTTVATGPPRRRSCRGPDAVGERGDDPRLPDARALEQPVPWPGELRSFWARR